MPVVTLDTLRRRRQQTDDPVTSQPTARWMSLPPRAVNCPWNCPPGLEYLTQLDQLLVHQTLESVLYLDITNIDFLHCQLTSKEETRWVLQKRYVKFCICWCRSQTGNKYKIKNSSGQDVYRAAEVSSLTKVFIGSRCFPFEIQILDEGREVMHVSQGLRCSSCCNPCCLQKVTVEAPPGNVIGYVEQAWSIWKPKFYIKNAQGDHVLTIHGPWFTTNLICGDVVFDVMSSDSSIQIGRICKKWGGFMDEMFTSELIDTFNVTFPKDLDVNVKATVLAAMFLIEFMFFNGKNRSINGSVLLTFVMILIIYSQLIIGIVNGFHSD